MEINGHVSTGNPYEVFKKRNARLFKHAYQPKELGISYEEALLKIASIENQEDRNLAYQIIGSGERYCEAVQPEGRVIGKGGKPRDTYRPKSSDETYKRSYESFRRSLGGVGLKPHSLRKICATRLVEAGLKEADLLKVMGWSSIMTAKSYLQPKKDEDLKRIFADMHKGLKP